MDTTNQTGQKINVEAGGEAAAAGLGRKRGERGVVGTGGREESNRDFLKSQTFRVITLSLSNGAILLLEENSAVFFNLFLFF